MLHWGHPSRGSELCTAVEMMYSLETLLRITGDPFWADYLERVAYNVLPAQVNDDFTGKQYYQQLNQVSATRAWRPFSTPHDDTDVLFGTLNGYPCCLSNMHQGWPKFTQNLWYATSDGGLAALVYAPSTVAAQISGVEVIIRETTGYPFRENVEFTVDYARKKVKKASFPLRFRVPVWCSSFTVLVNGEAVDVSPENGILCLHREWKRGDSVTLSFPMGLTTEAWYDQAWSFVRGPLLYGLKMEEHWNWLPFEGRDRYYGEGAWEVTSDTPWNYCLMRDRFSADDCRVEEQPWDGTWPWTPSAAPMRLYVPARELPHWQVPETVAFWTEDGNDSGRDVTLELIPYGCTTLRIAAFPTRIVPWDIDLR